MFSQPVIYSFSPASGPVGTTITITGFNFDPTPTNNIVYFGAVRANVSSASSTSLIVVVPTGATYQPITVTVNALTAASNIPFTLTSSAGGVIRSSSYEAKKDFTSGNNPNGVSLCDLDGDGKLDMVTANYNVNTISVLKNIGSAGTISFAAKTDYVTGYTPASTSIADIDSDGKLDIVVINFSSNTVSVFRNTSGGTISFALKIDFATEKFPYALSINDFNNDGKPDMAVLNNNSNTVSLFKNTGSIGTISFAGKADFATGITPTCIMVGDLDGDNKPDLIVPNYNSKFSILKNTSTLNVISFAAKFDYPTAAGILAGAISDLNGDGKQDIVCVGDGNAISVSRNLSNYGNILIASKDDYQIQGPSYSVSISDLNGDGKPDIVAATSIGSSVSVLQNTSINNTISFTSKTDFTTGSDPYCVTLGDMDGDGASDIVTANYSSNTISVLRNIIDTIPPPTISSFTPTSGKNGTFVTITGANFTRVSAVNFGNTPASSFRVVSPTSITAIVGAGSTGNIVITTSDGTASKPGFTFTNFPKIISLNPISGIIGTTVTITGKNFSSTPSNNVVFFGAVKATVSAASATSLTVTVPKGATYQPVTVSLNGFTAYSLKPFNITFSSTGSFTAGSFADNVDIVSGTHPIGKSMADFDGDGKPDIVVANNSSNTISVFKNTSISGSVSFASKIDYTIGSFPRNVFSGDIDADGKPDIFVANSDTISIFRNTCSNGNISFAAKVDFVAGTGPSDLVLEDFDGDGKTDYAVVNYNSFTISLFRNIGSVGNISFENKIDISTGQLLPERIAVGDLDGDGKPDLAVSDYTFDFDSLSIFKNNSIPGTIAFNEKIDYPKSRGALGIAIGDLDGDGKLDIATSCWASNKISIFRNSAQNGNISFEPKIDYTSGSFPESISISDLDGDGKPDVSMGNYISNTVSVLKNISTTGVISFASKVDFVTGTNPKSVCIADFDGDGKPDIATANINSNNISILKNNLSPLLKLCPRGNATLASALLGVTYQWQLSTDSIYFNNISDNTNYIGTTTATLNLNNIPSSFYGYQYRCVVDGINGDTLLITFSNTWIGSASSLWEEPTNWSCGKVPDENTDVIITSGTIVLNSSTTIRSLTLGTRVSFTVAPGLSFTITH